MCAIARLPLALFSLEGHLVDAEARCTRPWRKFLEAFFAALERVGTRSENLGMRIAESGSGRTSRSFDRCSANTTLKRPMRMAMQPPSSLQ